MEINAGRRTFVRIDVSEMLLRYGDREYRAPAGTGALVATGVIGNSVLVTAGISRRIGPLTEILRYDRPGESGNPGPWEVGGQFGVLSLGRSKTIKIPQFSPFSVGDEHGFGGRVAYNINRWLALDSAINYFYTSSHYEDPQRGGKILQGAFGPKFGYRTRRVGVFAKVRPGFLSYDSVHDNFLQPFPTTRLTHFAVDFGAVVECYPTRHTVVRFDFGHNAVFYGAAKVVAPPGFPFFGNFTERGFRDNGMQFTSGFGWRF